MRLLLFNLATDADDPILGFATRWVAALAKEVDFIHVVTMRAGRIAVPKNVRVYSVGKERGYNEFRRAWEFYRHLFRILKTDKVDVAFSHMIPIFTIMAAPVLKAKDIPIVTWYAHPHLSWKLKLAHRLSDRIVTSLPTAYPYKRDKLVVIGQGIDTDLFAPNGTKPDEPPMILCVGRLSPVKDHPTLIQATALLCKRWRKPFQVVILGSAPDSQGKAYVEAIHQLVEDLGLKGIARFEAAVPNHELPQWYRRCTIHVNLTPSGFGDKVALEAMSCARPCLVANEGFRHTLGKYADLLLFRYGDAEDLARRLQRILSLREGERQQIGVYLRERIVQHHSLSKLSERLLQVFQGLSGGKDG
jgi:glycosyltransferase involved in cell wall biosynthesis